MNKTVPGDQASWFRRETWDDVVQRCKFLMWLSWGGLIAAWLAESAGSAGAWVHAQPERLPNLVVIFVDDLGYGDIRPFGDPPYPTPHLDRLTQRGRAFTDFLVPSAVCSASRAALLTGCYPTRVGIEGALGPRSPIGISGQEITLGELCQSRGYATACIGKWHLGDHRDSLPLQHGFDFYFGLPYSNDMWPLHPDLMRLAPEVRARRQGYPDLPLLRGNDVVNPRVTAEDQRQLTTQYTEQATQFIQQNADRPFLLYVAHSMVHVPLYVSDKFAGRSGSGLFGDCMMEIDWSVGEIVRTLEALELTENTLIWFTSDNGPWLSYGDHAGNAGPLREGKGTSFEGGVRVPTLVCWPGRIPAGSRCAELATTMDILPTTAALIGASLPEHAIDGHDIRNLLFGDEQAESPHTALAIYYAGGELQAIRDRQYKLVFEHRFRTLDGKPGGTDGLPAAYQQMMMTQSLFDLHADPGETTDIAEQHADVVARLGAAAERMRQELGDRLRGQQGRAVRPAARVTWDAN